MYSGGCYVVKNEDLERYGRTDVDFCKIDAEIYYMDFSVSQRSSIPSVPTFSKISATSQ